LQFFANDPGLDTISQWTIQWGDGQTSVVEGSLSSSSHVYTTRQSSYAISVAARDEDGIWPASTRWVTVTNLAPTVSAALDAGLDPNNLREGERITLVGSAHDVTDLSLALEWQVFQGSQLVASSLSDPRVSFVPTNEGIYTATFRARDTAGAVGQTTINLVVLNAPPVVTRPDDQQAMEGGIASLILGSFLDMGAADSPWEVTVDWGDETPSNSLTVMDQGTLGSLAHTFADSGRYLVTLTVTDRNSGIGTGSFEVEVENRRPTATFHAPLSVVQGDSLVISLSDPVDVPADLASLLYAFDCGDGYGPFSATSAVTCSSNAAGTRTVRATIRDKDDGVSEYSTVMMVENALPIVSSIAGPASGPMGELLTYVVSFTDAGKLDTHTCQSEWGDGTTSIGTVTEAGGSGTCTVSHVYVASTGTGAAPYSIKITVTDNYLGSAASDSQVAIRQSAIVLSPSVCGALSLSGNVNLAIGGIVAVNSNCSTAITASGNTRLEALQIRVVGGTGIGGNARLTPAPVQMPAPGLSNPLEGRVVPTIPGSSPGTVDCGGSTMLTIAPGTYSRIAASNSCSLTLQPGTYVIHGGGLSISGQALVTGVGITIINSGDATFDSINLSGGSLSLRPPATGPYAGILIYQPAVNVRPLSLSGNLSAVEGTIYAPAAQLTLGTSTIKSSLVVNELRVVVNAPKALVVDASSRPNNDNDELRTESRLVQGVVSVAARNQNGSLSIAQQQRIVAAINTINSAIGMLGVTLVAVEQSSFNRADIRIEVGSTSPCGGYDDGVLGCQDPSGVITLIDGWHWYTGEDRDSITREGFDLQSIVTHELGHAIGLGHSTDPMSVMYESLARGTASRTFSVSDLQSMATAFDQYEAAELVTSIDALARVAMGDGGQPFSTKDRHPVVLLTDRGQRERRVESAYTASSIDLVLESALSTGLQFLINRPRIDSLDRVRTISEIGWTKSEAGEWNSDWNAKPNEAASELIDILLLGANVPGRLPIARHKTR
jgi:PKD repeat protein